MEGGVVEAGVSRRPEGEEEDAACGAECFLDPAGMPAVGKALGREDNQCATRADDGVSAGLFAGAEEGAGAGASVADAVGTGKGFAPFGTVLGPGAGATERFEDGEVEERGVAVGEPLASGVGHFPGAGKNWRFSRRSQARRGFSRM